MYASSTRPRVVAGFEMRPAAFLQFRRILLDPPIDGRVIDVQPSFEHHLFEIAITERRAEIPADTQEHDLGLEMAPFEWDLLDHDEKLLCSVPNKEEFIITPSFLQHNPYAPELNPQEGVWNLLKRVELKNVCCLDWQQLRREVLLAKERLRHRKSILRQCFAHAGCLL
jgi:hypothetical protein